MLEKHDRAQQWNMRKADYFRINCHRGHITEKGSDITNHVYTLHRLLCRYFLQKLPRVLVKMLPDMVMVMGKGLPVTREWLGWTGAAGRRGRGLGIIPSPLLLLECGSPLLLVECGSPLPLLVLCILPSCQLIFLRPSMSPSLSPHSSAAFSSWSNVS